MGFPINTTATFQTLSQTSQGMFFVLKRDGTILECKGGDFEFLFHSPEKYINKRMQDLLPTDVGENFEVLIATFDTFDKPAAIKFEINTIRKEHWFEANIVSISEENLIVIVREITNLIRSERREKEHVNRLATLRSIDQIIASSLDARVTYSMILRQVTDQLSLDAAAILLFDQNTQTLEFAAGHGFTTTALQHTRLRVGEGYAGQVVLKKSIVQANNLQSWNTELIRSRDFQQEGFMAYLGVPLIAKGQVLGVLELFHHSPLHPDKEWFDFLELLAGQAAIAVDNAFMFENLQKSNYELLLAYDATIEGWSRALEQRDKETDGHAKNVTGITLKLAHSMNITPEKMVHIRRGAMLHDIGKMGIPDSILRKPGPLTDEEWVIMKQHPQYAIDFLGPITHLKPSLDIPYYHHEHWDGTGYPHGLKEEQIPISARIFSVADVYDALISDRPYRSAWSQQKAIDYIRNQSGKLFDPMVVKTFLSIYDRK